MRPDPQRPTRTRDELWSDLAADAWHRGHAATDPNGARRWLERARRIAPDDDTVGLSLALACLRGGDPAAALALFAPIADRWDLLEAWLGVAGAALQQGDGPAAARAMQAALSRHAAATEAGGLAATVARMAGLPGWCGIDAQGWLVADLPAQAILDGKTLDLSWEAGRARIPAGRNLVVEQAGIGLLGSPLDLVAIGAVEGFVQAEPDGALAGWAWHPGNPGREPLIQLRFATGRTRRITASDLVEVSDSGRPLARPRRFRIPAAAIPPGPVSLRAGRELWGSPIDPGLERRSAAGSERSFTPIWADVTGRPQTASPDAPPADVVVPVYRGVRTAMACIDSVLATLPRTSRLHVVDDGAVDAELGAALDRLARAGAILLHRLANNRGFPSAANTGLHAAAGRDVVLLNSDTLVPPGWLQQLAAAAHSAPDIGSACPLSNEATILSYPKRDGGNAMTDPGPTLGAGARRERGRHRHHPGFRRILHVYAPRLHRCGRPAARRPLGAGLWRGERLVPARPSPRMAPCGRDGC